MGYDTKFRGRFKFDKPLTPAQINYLKKFSETRRMKRNNEKLMNMPDPIREAVNLPLGVEGEYFVDGKGFAGQDRDDSVINSNQPATSQAGLWCQWVPDDAGTMLKWNGAEKFYNYIEWLKYIIEHFIEPWGYTLKGKVKWYGEDPGDGGTIKVVDNVVTIIH